MSLSVGSVAFGAVLGASLLGLVQFLSGNGLAEQFRPSGRALMAVTRHDSESSAKDSPVGAPNWIGVLPDNIIDQQLPMVRTPHYGMHVVALGKNGSLFHKYQTGPLNATGPMPFIPMTDWLLLTKSTHKNVSGAPLPLIFGNSPAIALNADGRIELFVGYQPDSLDIWQMYQKDPKDPLSWSTPRPPYCDPSYDDCVKCLAKPKCAAKFWSDGYTWTTSQQSLWLDPRDNLLRLTWRNFDGHMYEKVQSSPSNSTHWVIDALQYPVFE